MNMILRSQGLVPNPSCSFCDHEELEIFSKAKLDLEPTSLIIGFGYSFLFRVISLQVISRVAAARLHSKLSATRVGILQPRFPHT